MNFYLFVFLYLFYATASIFLFTITTQGWSVVLWIIPLLIYYFLLPILSFLMILSFAISDKKPLAIRVKIKFKLLINTICLQILGLLLNTGDSGDGNSLRLYVFVIDRFYQSNIWLENVRSELWGIGIITKLLYFIFFYIFLFWTLNTWKTASKK